MFALHAHAFSLYNSHFVVSRSKFEQKYWWIDLYRYPSLSPPLSHTHRKPPPTTAVFHRFTGFDPWDSVQISCNSKKIDAWWGLLFVCVHVAFDRLSRVSCEVLFILIISVLKWLIWDFYVFFWSGLGICWLGFRVLIWFEEFWVLEYWLEVFFEVGRFDFGEKWGQSFAWTSCVVRRRRLNGRKDGAWNQVDLQRCVPTAGICLSPNFGFVAMNFFIFAHEVFLWCKGSLGIWRFCWIPPEKSWLFFFSVRGKSFFVCVAYLYCCLYLGISVFHHISLQLDFFSPFLIMVLLCERLNFSLSLSLCSIPRLLIMIYRKC